MIVEYMNRERHQERFILKAKEWARERLGWREWKKTEVGLKEVKEIEKKETKSLLGLDNSEEAYVIASR